MNEKLEEIRSKLPWIERLVLINAPAPLAPELAAQLHEQEERRANQLKGNKKLTQFKPADDPVLNDFKRETMFHRQAQNAVIEGIARLKSLGVSTKRPIDYYAEMAKSDSHMQKVKENLLKKKNEAQRSEKIRQLRQQKKVAKQMQVEATLKKHAEKRKLLEEVKKYRKGARKDLDFLDNKKGIHSKRAMEKKKKKDVKFGFGGKKRGIKRNTKDSSADVSDYKKPKIGNKKGGAKLRPGKNRRVQIKAKRK